MPEVLQSQIAKRVQELCDVARERFDVSITPTIRYNVTGTTAGLAVFETKTLDFNYELAKHNKKEFVQQIVGHEVGHLVANECYNHTGHGSEWKEVMREMGLRPERCHSLDVSGVARQPKRYPYDCGCQTRMLDRTYHTKAQENGYQCNLCQVRLKFVGPDKDLRRFRVGTKANQVARVLRQYHCDGLSFTDQIVLIMDQFGYSYNTARSYYYEFRPAS